uniref:Uncharacterized protein n=1 Tax=Anguilla anguilla TaxID=7936 RepID=A0A0E9TUY6_ANGAN
MMAMTRLGQGN